MTGQELMNGLEYTPFRLSTCAIRREIFVWLSMILLAAFSLHAEPVSPRRVTSPGPEPGEEQNHSGNDTASPRQQRALPSSQTPADEKNGFELMGWATVGKGTTGGAGGKTVTVSKPEDLIHYLERPEPFIIQVKGTINFDRKFPGSKSNGRYYVESDKTIIGLGSDARIHCGEFRLRGVSNVIIRNLTFSDAPDTAIAITEGTTHVWIDHNDLISAGDGLLDITGGADLITVSWNRFADHNKVSLVGAGDKQEGDRGRLRVTYHHNWFLRTTQRHPRVRYGQVHLFNNLYDNVDAGIGIGVEAQIVSKGNFFDNASTPYHFQDTPDQPGKMNDTGSLFGQGDLPPLDDVEPTWSPRDHYTYTVDTIQAVPEIVRKGAGVGVINRVDSSPDLRDGDPRENKNSTKPKKPKSPSRRN